MIKARSKLSLLLLALPSLAAAETKVESVGLGFTFVAYSDCLEKLAFAATLARTLEAKGISLKSNLGRSTYCRDLFPNITSVDPDGDVGIDVNYTPKFNVVGKKQNGSQITLDSGAGTANLGQSQTGVSINPAGLKEKGNMGSAAAAASPASPGDSFAPPQNPVGAANAPAEIGRGGGFAATADSGSNFEQASAGSSKAGGASAEGDAGPLVPSYEVASSGEAAKPNGVPGPSASGGGFLPSSAWNKGAPAAGPESSKQAKVTGNSPESKLAQKRQQQELSALEKMLLDPAARVPSAVHESDRAAENVSLFARVGKLYKAKRPFFRREK